MLIWSTTLEAAANGLAGARAKETAVQLYERVVSRLCTHSEQPRLLRAAAAYFDGLTKEQTKLLCTQACFQRLYPALKPHLSGASNDCRLQTLKILSHFPLPQWRQEGLQGLAGEDAAREDECDVFRLCLSAEEVPATVASFRERTMIMERLQVGACVAERWS